ncbi:MAG TPA: alpha/beta hydrolase [Candidatus Obscuribacterales bacterium]
MSQVTEETGDTQSESTEICRLRDHPHFESHQRESKGKMRIAFNWRWFLAAIAVVTVSFAASLYVCLSPYGGTDLYSLVIFHPAKPEQFWQEPHTVCGARKQDVCFLSQNGMRLHGWHFEQPNSDFTVLLSHGNGGNITNCIAEIEMLLERKLSVFAYDYEGYGKSEGKPSLDNICMDARAAYDFLVSEKGVNPEEIILFGESLGTAVTGNLASKVNCAAIILQSPLASIHRRGVEICAVIAMWYPPFMWPEQGLDNIAAFQKPHHPLFLVSGTADRMIPVGHADDLFKAAAAPKTYVRVEGAGHSHDETLLKCPLYANSLDRFLAQLRSDRAILKGRQSH